jgi:hypothetical protein
VVLPDPVDVESEPVEPEPDVVPREYDVHRGSLWRPFATERTHTKPSPEAVSVAGEAATLCVWPFEPSCGPQLR